jgi:protein-disulfide isomerase
MLIVLKNYLIKILFISFFMLFSSFSYSQNNDEIFIGNKNAKVEIKIYSSFTCPHCANFHKNTYPKLVKEYASKDLIKISFIDFPLDIAALNAAKIVRCSTKESSILLIDEIYKNQNTWSAGDKIQEINKKLFLIANKFNLSDEKLSNCLKDQKLEEKILNDRIDGQKKYSINSTPTIIINEKKFEGNLTFENLSKEISKILK